MQLHPMLEDIELRFRHTSGDVGPIKCAGTLSVEAVKEKLLAAWPNGMDEAIHSLLIHQLTRIMTGLIISSRSYDQLLSFTCQCVSR